MALPALALSPDGELDHWREQLGSLCHSRTTPVLLVGGAAGARRQLARMLHELSYSGSELAPFVELDAHSLSKSHWESELLGQERGEDDTTPARRGLLELAHGGSLFLDDVSAMPLVAQTLLLRFLDDMRLRRVGSHHEITLDLRLILATSSEPQLLVEGGHLRPDLYRRLSFFRVEVPAQQPIGKHQPSFFQVDAQSDGVPPPLDAVEQAYVRRVLEHTGGKRMVAAQLLGISYPTFLKRLRELSLSSEAAPSSSPAPSSEAADVDAALARRG